MEITSTDARLCACAIFNFNFDFDFPFIKKQ